MMRRTMIALTLLALPSAVCSAQYPCPGSWESCPVPPPYGGLDYDLAEAGVVFATAVLDYAEASAHGAGSVGVFFDTYGSEQAAKSGGDKECYEWKTDEPGCTGEIEYVYGVVKTNEGYAIALKKSAAVEVHARVELDCTALKGPLVAEGYGRVVNTTKTVDTTVGSSGIGVTFRSPGLADPTKVTIPMQIESDYAPYHCDVKLETERKTLAECMFSVNKTGQSDGHVDGTITYERGLGIGCPNGG